MIYAKDIMSEHVIMIEPNMIIRQVAHLMLRDRVSAFPVVEKGQFLIGIITLTDLFTMFSKFAAGKDIEEFYQHLPEFQKLTVAGVMSKEVITINPMTSLLEIIQILVDKSVHTFPVTEGHIIVGIVSRHDILNALYAYDS